MSEVYVAMIYEWLDDDLVLHILGVYSDIKKAVSATNERAQREGYVVSTVDEAENRMDNTVICWVKENSSCGNDEILIHQWEVE